MFKAFQEGGAKFGKALLEQKTHNHTFVPTLCYGLDALTLTDQNLHKIDAWYPPHKFLRRVLGIKATYYSRVSNWDVWNQANRPQLPSTTFHTLQIKALASIVCSSPEDPMHRIVFCAPLKDRIQAQGKRQGMQFPYWIGVTTHSRFPLKYGYGTTPLVDMPRSSFMGKTNSM